ncbi:unnamed protein product [Clonostachys rosea f. rosea IK726]|uniref:Uncharacterized protein n=1 Tax=Clonostachys rosea f. rosea IK726 TaxID=1349383 RepID=A0ACA9UPD3_BIOOC|nr:unnamed protein product [Clonostachys rosea f. rosea IK726]
MAQDTDVGAMEKREGKEESGPGQRAANGQTGERDSWEKGGRLKEGMGTEGEQASGSQNEMIVALAKSVVARWGDLAIHEGTSL